MKIKSSIVTILLSIVLAILFLQAGLPVINARAAEPSPMPAATEKPSEVCDSSRSIQVSGSAMINVSPDRALIQLGVQSNGLTPEMVEAANSFAIQKVIKALLALGIDARDISTDLYIIQPVYEDYDSLYIKGYRINNIVAVTLRDVNKTGPSLAAALGAGANQVIKVEFYTSELRKYRDQARELAMKAAREKAQALAQAAGAQAGCVLNISENSWSYYNGGWYGASTQNQWTQNTVQNAAPSGAPNGNPGEEPISLGQISVKAEVAASFGLR